MGSALLLLEDVTLMRGESPYGAASHRRPSRERPASSARRAPAGPIDAVRLQLAFLYVLLGGVSPAAQIGVRRSARLRPGQ
jgi:hypothetical protein